MLPENGQAGSLSQDKLGGVADQCFKLIESVGNKSCDLRERWNNRLVLENRSLSELYINGKFGVVLYGDVAFATLKGKHAKWACSIVADDIPCGPITAYQGIEALNLRDCDGRNDEVMFVVIVEIVEPPKHLIRGILRPYIFKDEFFPSGKSFLYQIQDGGGFENLPFGSNGEVGFCSGFDRSNHCRGKVIKRRSEIMDGIPQHESQDAWDRLLGAIMNIDAGFVSVGKHRASVERNFVELMAQRLSGDAQLVNVAVGPFNL